MFQIVYASAACEAFPPHALRSLLQQARTRNEMYGVTGMLLYHEGSFLQILEGPKDSVDHIYASIERDPRHHNARVLLRQVIKKKEFADWTMAFVDTASWARVHSACSTTPASLWRPATVPGPTFPRRPASMYASFTMAFAAKSERGAPTPSTIQLFARFGRQ